MPTTIFPNYPPGGHIDDENNKKAIEALQNAKEYSILDDEDVFQQESILSKFAKTKYSINIWKSFFFLYIKFLFPDKLIISDPVEFNDRSFLAHLYQLPWAEPLFTRRIEQSMLMGKHMTFCRVSNETLSLVSVK